MGTPEDVAAEKYFTPPTLTGMLTVALHEDQEPNSDTEAEMREGYLSLIKDTFKEWLKTVGLTDYYSPDKNGREFNTTESLRQLLIMLVDEP